MPRTQPLNLNQQRAVGQLARRQGCRCIECGSYDYLKSAGRAVQSVNHIAVNLYCTSEVHPVQILALGKSFPLTFDQAKAIGLRVPGETAPRA